MRLRLGSPGYLGLCLAGILGGLLAGCGATGPDISKPQPGESVNPNYLHEFQAAREHATDFEKSVLADDIFTEAEIFEYRDRLSSCVAQDSDFELVYDVNFGSYYVLPGSAPGDDPAISQQQNERVQECFAQVGEQLIGLYQYLYMNPDKADKEAEIVACLQRHNFVPASYTKENYLEFLESVSTQSPLSPPWDQLDPQAMQCEYDPFNQP